MGQNPQRNRSQERVEIWMFFAEKSSPSARVSVEIRGPYERALDLANTIRERVKTWEGWEEI
jgi:hypothetical protein